MCELRVLVQNKPFLVLKCFDLFQLYVQLLTNLPYLLLYVCEFNYISRDYALSDCHFQSLLNAKHNMTHAGAALLFTGICLV